MKKITLIYSLFMASGLFGQKVWIEPEVINPEDSVKIYVDISKCDCQKLLNVTEDLFIWSWLPKDRPEGNLTANGKWTESNPLLKMKKESANVYSYKMIPTIFYGVTAVDVYAKDFHFLIKGVDGGSGGGCDENKTEDLKIEIDPPANGPVKVYTFPKPLDKDTMSFGSADVFTILYDNKLEEKDSLKGKKDFFVNVTVKTDAGRDLSYVGILRTGEKPELAMWQIENNIFQFSFIPEELFVTFLNANEKISLVRAQIVRKVLTSTNDAVNGTFTYYFNNKCN